MTVRHLDHAVPRAAVAAEPAVTRRRSGWVEIGLLLVLYVGYSASRLFASDDLISARERAGRILSWEHASGLDIEANLGHWFATHDFAGVAATYWYASAHYLVTAVVMLLLFFKGGAHYGRARWALVIATVIALVMYILMPTAPPRLSGTGHIDLMAEHASVGWWGSDASAPKGLGGLTNELAAMPSMHAGWALWVAVVAFAVGAKLRWKVLGSAYALITAIVVVGTGNHWVADVLVGWFVVLVAALIAWPRDLSIRLRRPQQASRGA